MYIYIYMVYQYTYIHIIVCRRVESSHPHSLTQCRLRSACSSLSLSRSRHSPDSFTLSIHRLHWRYDDIRCKIKQNEDRLFFRPKEPNISVCVREPVWLPACLCMCITRYHQLILAIIIMIAMMIIIKQCVYIYRCNTSKNIFFCSWIFAFFDLFGRHVERKLFYIDIYIYQAIFLATIPLFSAVLIDIFTALTTTAAVQKP